MVYLVNDTERSNGKCVESVQPQWAGNMLSRGTNVELCPFYLYILNFKHIIQLKYIGTLVLQLTH